MEKAEKVKENVENIKKVRKNMLKVEKERQKLRKCQFYQPSTILSWTARFLLNVIIVKTMK